MLYRLRPHVNAQSGHWQEQTDMHHAFVRLMSCGENLKRFLTGGQEQKLERMQAQPMVSSGWKRRDFWPVLARFFVGLKKHGRPRLWEHVEEFVTTGMKLTEQIEVWLREVWRRE